MSLRAEPGIATSTTTVPPAEGVEKLLARHRLLKKRLHEYEERYGMPTLEFIEAWRSGRIPEPEDPDLLAEFMAWETLYETLRRLEERIREEARAAWLRQFSRES